jgi:hypothetical protein
MLNIDEKNVSLAMPKTGGALTIGSKKHVFLAIVFGLHYLCPIITITKL